MTLTKIPQVGDKVRAINDRAHWVTEGNTYEITYIDSDGDAIFEDDAGDEGYIDSKVFEYFELVSAEPSQPVGRITLGAVQTTQTLNLDVVTYDIVVSTDAEGYATLQRLAEESDNQARRAVIERQIGELQRELEAL